jgi:hypothetical protein
MKNQPERLSVRLGHVFRVLAAASSLPPTCFPLIESSGVKKLKSVLRRDTATSMRDACATRNLRC